MAKKKNQNLTLLLFVAPALIVYIVFKLFPAISGIFYSFTNWNGINKTYDFIGLSNFIEIGKDINFWKSMWFTAKYVLVMVIAGNVTALTLALALKAGKRQKAYSGLFFTCPI